MKHKHLNHLNIVSPNDRLACAMQWLPGTELSAATFVAVPHGAALSVDFVNSYDSWNSAYSKLEVHSLQAGRLDAACVSVRCFIFEATARSCRCYASSHSSRRRPCAGCRVECSTPALTSARRHRPPRGVARKLARVRSSYEDVSAAHAGARSWVC